MDREEAIKLVERIEALTPTTEDLDVCEPTEYLTWNWGGEGATIEKVLQDGYFCFEWEGEDLNSFIIKKGDIYYNIDADEAECYLFGSRQHKDVFTPFDKDISIVLD